MRLCGLVVRNHSRIDDLDIEVRGHLVLVGANESGKSSLLRCIDLLIGSSVAQLYMRIDETDFRVSDAPFVVEAKFGEFNDEEKALFPDEIDVHDDGSRSLQMRLEATLEGEELAISRTCPGGSTGRQVSRAQLAAFDWKYVAAISGDRDIRADRRGRLGEIISSLDLAGERDDFVAIGTQLQELLDESKQLGSAKTALATEMAKGLPGTITSDDLRFVSGTTADSNLLSDVRLHIDRSGGTRDLSQQSDGIKALLGIVLHDYGRGGDSMLAVDEPEVHLHPTSQRRLGQLLAGSESQRVLATHSPDIVSQFEPESIVVMRPGGIAVQPQAGFLDKQDRMLLRWWMSDRLEPLTANIIVAVEGISDRVILESCARATGRDLNALGISVVETGGSGDMPAVRKLFGPDGFDVPMVILVDDDAKAAIAKDIGAEETELCNEGVHISDPDLEAEYVAALGPVDTWKAIEESGLFSQNERANCARSGPGGTRTVEDIAAFCRRKSKNYKVRAAMAVGEVIDSASANQIESIESVLAEAELL